MLVFTLKRKIQPYDGRFSCRLQLALNQDSIPVSSYIKLSARFANKFTIRFKCIKITSFPPTLSTEGITLIILDSPILEYWSSV